MTQINVCGGVLKRTTRADCKSAGIMPSEVRILPPPPLVIRKGILSG